MFASGRMGLAWQSNRPSRLAGEGLHAIRTAGGQFLGGVLEGVGDVPEQVDPGLDERRRARGLVVSSSHARRTEMGFVVAKARLSEMRQPENSPGEDRRPWRRNLGGTLSNRLALSHRGQI